MKKAAAACLALLLVIALAGCDFNLAALLRKEPDWDNITVEPLTAGSPYKYYFSQLGNKEKQAYNNVLETIAEMPGDVEIPYLDEEELTTFFKALLYDNPELFFLGRSCNISIRGLKSFFVPEYVMDKEEYTQKKALLDKEAAAVAAAAAGTDAEKELAVHDWLVDNVTYETEETGSESDAYGAIVDRKAACEGYAKAAKLLFDLTGIECYVVSGVSKAFAEQPENHMWNIVNIEGDYYHLDVTWDDPINQTGAGEPRYAYFNLTDGEISKTHSGYQSANACAATRENFFVKNGLYFEEYNENTEKSIARGIAAAAEKGRKHLEVKFGSAKTYGTAYKKLFKDEKIYEVLTAADKASRKNIVRHSVSYIQNETFHILEIIFQTA